MRRNRIRLTESQLHRVIKESVKKVLRGSSFRKKQRINEGGHLYWQDEDGTPHTNSTETYRGVPGTTYIDHGSWSDAEVLYDGHEINVNDIEDSLWYSYKDECEYNGEHPTDTGFEEWIDEQGVEYIQGELDDIVWAMEGCP